MSYKGEKYVNEIASGRLLIIHDKHIKNAFSSHGKRCVDALKRIITGGTRSGRMYTYDGRRIRASAPGEPPANRSGRLANSNAFTSRSKELAIFNTAFNKRAPYPSYLEEGTKKMEARAWFEKTIIRLEPLLYGDFLKFKAKI
jgi:hypothetical protein